MGKTGDFLRFFLFFLSIIYNKLDLTGLQISVNGGSKIQIREASWFWPSVSVASFSQAQWGFVTDTSPVSHDLMY